MDIPGMFRAIFSISSCHNKVKVPIRKKVIDDFDFTCNEGKKTAASS